MSLFTKLEQEMMEFRFRPEKSLGQNFAMDESMLNLLVEEADLKKDDIVLEIGCGTGFLTEKLLEHCKVVGIEKDEKLCVILRKKFAGHKNFKLIEGDFLEVKIPKFTKVVSLPPYAISTEIMVKLYSLKFLRVVIVFQREFAEKMVAEPGFYEYGYLSALTWLFTKPEIVAPNLSPRYFFPSPESFSAIIKLERNKVTVKDYDNFLMFIKNVFRYKNKHLSNALRNALKSGQVKFSGKKDPEKILEKLGLGDEKVNLTEAEDFLVLFNELSQ